MEKSLEELQREWSELWKQVHNVTHHTRAKLESDFRHCAEQIKLAIRAKVDKQPKPAPDSSGEETPPGPGPVPPPMTATRPIGATRPARPSTE